MRTVTVISILAVLLVSCVDPGRTAKQAGFDALRSGDAEAAAASFEQALKSGTGGHAERMRVYDGLVEAYVLLGRTKEADQILEQWRSDNPSDLDLARMSYLRANAQASAGDFQRALLTLDDAIDRYAKLGGGQPLGTAYVLKAQIEIREGRPEDAEISLYAALDAIDPGVYPNLAAMARTLLDGLTKSQD